jgi:hypothetical protein
MDLDLVSYLQGHERQLKVMELNAGFGCSAYGLSIFLRVGTVF